MGSLNPSLGSPVPKGRDSGETHDDTDTGKDSPVGCLVPSSTLLILSRMVRLTLGLTSFLEVNEHPERSSENARLCSRHPLGERWCQDELKWKEKVRSSSLFWMRGRRRSISCILENPQKCSASETAVIRPTTALCCCLHPGWNINPELLFQVCKSCVFTWREA